MPAYERSAIMPKPVDPKFIFEHAHEVLRASDRLEQIQRQTPTMDGAIPASFLNAFSIELLLKCLYAIETNAMPPRGHNLHRLFMILSKPTRQRITVFWDWYAQAMKYQWDVDEQIVNGKEQVIRIAIHRNLEGALQLGSHAFERLRYWYEKGPDDYYFYIGVLPQMLTSMILELRPEWGGHPAGWKMPDDFSKPAPVQPVPASVSIRRTWGE